MDQIVTHLLSKPDEILCFVESARESSNPIVQAKIAYVMAGIGIHLNSLALFKKGRGIELLVKMANTCESQLVRQATVYAISKIYTGKPAGRGAAESSLFNQALVAMANRPDNNPKVQIEIASAMVKVYNIAPKRGGYGLVQAKALEALVKMANAVNSTPNARSQFAKAIGTFAQTKCRVRPLIDMGGIEALVAMAKQENTPEGRLNIIDAFSKFLPDHVHHKHFIKKGGVDALIAMVNEKNTPNGRASIAFVMGETAQKGDAGVNKLIEAGGIEALLEMAKQENIPVGRSNITVVMGQIAKIGAAG